MSVGRIETEGDLARFIDARLQAFAPRIRQLQALVLSGDGAPSGAPAAPRAVYLDEAGGVGSTFYVWDGTSWTAVA